MKIAGVERRNKPNMTVLWPMQSYSTRGWVYRESQGWIFAELTPDELAEFKSYEYGITIPRMRVRLPYSPVWGFIKPKQEKPGSYETWLWADEVKTCRELGCEVTVQDGFGWKEWGVPFDWKPPLQYKERIFIYAFVNELTQEVYVGQTENVERRWTQHLRDTANADKAALIQSLRRQGQEPKPIILEEVAGEKTYERERYWTSYYKSKGYKVTNHDYRSLSSFDGE